MTAVFEKIFKLKEHGTSVKTEILAGLTTFMSMAYIIVVNPDILGSAGMPKGAVMTATILVCVIATAFMGVVARLPFALGPGMGLNAFFAYTICGAMGYSWQFALTVVFFEGIIFILLTLCNIREAFVKAIPDNMRKAIPVGVGLFITLIGMSNAGIVERGAGTLITLSRDVFAISGASLALIGVLIIGVMLHFKVKGALLIGIFIITILGIPLGVTKIPTKFSPFAMPASIEPTFWQFDFSWMDSTKGIVDFMLLLFTLLLVNIFDTLGTLIGVVTKSKMFDKDGNIPHIKQAFLSDAVGTTVSGVLGTSVVTAYVESAAGVAAGGRTGLTSLVVAGAFFMALFLSPLFLIVPSAAVSPALILVGLFMVDSAKLVDFENYEEAIPAFFTMIMMPFAYSIADGIIFGILSFILIKIAVGKIRQVHPITYAVGLFFVLKFFMH